MRKILLMAFIVSASMILNVSAATFEVDPVYSSIIFKLRHLSGYSIGNFNTFQGFIDTTDDFGKITGISAKVLIPSINTRHPERDADLLSERFFDAEKFPVGTFVGKKIEGGKLIGDLTLKGKKKEVALDYKYYGTAKDQFGRTKAGFSASGIINRKDFGISFNKKIDNGQMLLGDDVELIIEIEGILKD